MQLLEIHIFIFFIFYTTFVSANEESISLNISNSSSSVSRFLQCNTNTFALICDPDHVFTDDERKDLKRELQKLENQTRKFAINVMFKGDEGITGDVIISKNLSGGSNAIQEKAVAVEILSSWKIYNSDQRGFAIVFSTKTNKFWAIKQQNVPLSIEEFEKIFDSQKLLFEMKSYKQAFSNIINKILEKAVSKIEKKITTRTPLFDGLYHKYYERKKLNSWGIVLPDEYPPILSMEKIEKIETHSFFQNFIVFSLYFLFCIFIFIVFISFARRQFFRSTAEMEENIRNTLEVDTTESATPLCPIKSHGNNNMCPPPPSYFEAVAFNSSENGKMSRDDKFWDGFVAASRMMHTIQSYDRARIDAPIEHLPNILIKCERNEINPSAPFEDKNE